jgi:hypothetical protein
LLELVDILFAVNDFQGPIGQYSPDISRMVPPLGINSLSGVLWVFEVLGENGRTSHANLTLWAFFISGVVHLGDIHQLELGHSVGTSHMAVISISWICDETSSK